MPKVSVLIPIYNVEKYISRCAKSLFEQTLHDIEYIFVNDCTPDNSMDILNKVIEDYPHKKNHIKIIHHSENKGLAAARNTGVMAACGEYIIPCDSDDWVEPEIYEEMYKKAVNDNSDIVTCDFLKEKTKRIEYQKQDSINDPHEYIKSIWDQKNYPAIWSRLIKRSFFINHNLNFTEGINMGEDLLIVSKIFFYAKRISYINKALYHYEMKNFGSIVRGFNEESSNQLIWAIEEIESFYKKWSDFENFESNINNMKIHIKYLHFKQKNMNLCKRSITLFSGLNTSIFSSTLKTSRKIKLLIVIKYPLLLSAIKKI